MRVRDILQAWRTILGGKRPTLSIEITRECPLRCPGCYAYEDNHLGGDLTLRDLTDFKGDALVEGVLRVVEQERPLHVSLVGGDPLVRYRELDVLIPKLIERNIHVQVVTSAFRKLNPEWAKYKRFHVSVSVDGLAEDHDARRAPATYDRILENIKGHKVTVHCTITSQQMRRAGYLEEFVSFWSGQQAVERIWFSLFTPQRGARLPEILSERQRKQAVEELLDLRLRYAKLAMPPALLKEFLNPPQSPKECIFAMTTRTISADLKTRITPCQLGGDPDCAECGCMASMALAAVGNHKLAGLIPVSALFKASFHAGELLNPTPEAEPEPALRILQ